DLVHDHRVDLAGLDAGQQALQRRPVHVAAAEATVVVRLRQADPAGMGLALDVGLGCFALGIERAELPVESLVGRFARVDGTTDSRRSGWLATAARAFAHRLAPCGPTRKKR